MVCAIGTLTVLLQPAHRPLDPDYTPSESIGDIAGEDPLDFDNRLALGLAVLLGWVLFACWSIDCGRHADDARRWAAARVCGEMIECTRDVVCVNHDRAAHRGVLP